MMVGKHSSKVRYMLGAWLAMVLVLVPQASMAQDLEAEKSRLESVLENNPDDVDVLLRYANLLGNMGDYAASLRTLDRALVIAPDYLALRIARARVLGFAGRIAEGLVEIDAVIQGAPANSAAHAMRGRLLYYRGDAAAAVTAFRTALKADPANVDAKSGLEDAEKARKSFDNSTAWRVDTSYTHSTFGRTARKPWQEKTVRLGYRFADATSLHLQVRDVLRGTQVDQEYQGGVVLPLAPGAVGYVNLGVTPRTDFLPRWHAETGTTWRVREGQTGEALAATVVNIDARWRRYATGHTVNFNPGVTQYIFGGTAWGTATWLNGHDMATDKRLPGWSVRADWQSNERIRAFAGYANAPEVDGGVTVGVISKFAGVTAQLMGNLEATVALAQERRKRSYTRNAATLSLGFRF